MHILYKLDSIVLSALEIGLETATFVVGYHLTY
ncbi:hypothetical protein HMPREF1092_02244 [Clostridium thermobutyricum]|uniref:Uncharacterized protein n=1 Tax=Clostridium thermobutyricum TaxID=29372 RepID=N9XMG5_9CLOT|nr:hypothetical protein HMPREF1092_02244 [Clostridium thermobutyricum]